MESFTGTIVNLNLAGTLLVLAGSIGLIGAVVYALRTGKLSSDMLSSGTAMLEGVQSAAEALAKATDNPAISVAAFIFKTAGQAARAAEQLCKTGEIGPDERNAKAKEIAEELLQMAGIEITDDRKAAIAVLLEAECDAMGHSVPQVVGFAANVEPGEDGKPTITGLRSMSRDEIEKALGGQNEEETESAAKSMTDRVNAGDANGNHADSQPPDDAPSDDTAEGADKAEDAHTEEGDGE